MLKHNLWCGTKRLVIPLPVRFVSLGATTHHSLASAFSLLVGIVPLQTQTLRFAHALLQIHIKKNKKQKTGTQLLPRTYMYIYISHLSRLQCVAQQSTDRGLLLAGVVVVVSPGLVVHKTRRFLGLRNRIDDTRMVAETISNVVLHNFL